MVETSHPGNIGAVARAMLNMSLTQLYLVNPKELPNEVTQALASHAHELVDRAVIVENLTDALTGVNLVIGTSARKRRLDLPLITIESSAAQSIAQIQQGNEVAIVFGRERTGLYNDELLACHLHAYIPTNERYNSLNLAQSVQIFCYEVYKQLQYKLSELPSSPLQMAKTASANSLANFYDYLAEQLKQSGFVTPEHAHSVLNKMKRLFQRAQLEEQEINILRGFLNCISTDTDKKR